ncbi:OmpA family protein, partial [Phocaeicola massiliensis]|nr:OmpA family protein [Phocaeicola massiliensis]
LAKKRARMVADELINRYGISADRLSVDSKGSEVQPFTTNDWNRVVIMIAE